MSSECHQCGHGLGPEDRFCAACGAPVVAHEDTDRTGLVRADLQDTGPVPLVEGLSGLSRGMSVIVVQRGPEIGQRFELSGPTLTAGRADDTDILLDDITVSRHHAEFVARSDGGWDLVDKGSLNGTYVNRRSVERVELQTGDLIQIGKFRLQYVHADEDHSAQ